MDVYGMPAPDHVFRIDDLLDLPNDDGLFSSAPSSSDDSLAPRHDPQLPPLPSDISSSSAFFSDGFSFPPSDDVAELEWLSRFVDDSFSDVPPTEFLPAGTLSVRPGSGFPGKPRTKRPKPVPNSASDGKIKERGGSASFAAARGDADGVVRRCTHCASEKTPQWRTGPMGPKTLCNACGVRYKSGRLVPEYRPAASPTFVLTQHSNSHRKVMELRRQKEVMQQEQLYRHQQQQQQQQQQQKHFQVC